MAYLITLQDVIRQHTGALNPQGRTLYEGFVHLGSTVILGEEDAEKDKWFLATQGMSGHSNYIPLDTDVSPDPVEQRLNQVRQLRAAGMLVELAVDPNPEVVAALHLEMVPTLLYLHPRFSQPSFRPDFESVARPWDELTSAVEYQITQRAKRVLPEPEVVAEWIE